MTTTGVLGRRWRAEVTPWGAVAPWDGSAVLDWAVAADDRWHRPAEEIAVRSHRVDAMPVVETRMSVPGGDAVQRVWSVADDGGLTVVEVVNESPMPIAVGFTRADLLTTRPPADVPIEGIDLPAGSIVLPVGHRSRIAVALRHDRPGAGPLPDDLPGPESVARGWASLIERAGGLRLPDDRLAALVTAARADLLLEGVEPANADPVAHLIGLGELLRLGELTAAAASDAALDVAGAVAAIAREDGWDVEAALDAAARVLHHADERRGVRDVEAVIAARPDPAAPPADPPAGVRAVPAVERMVARRGVLAPHGVPAEWRGQSWEAHGLPAGPASTLSFAVRWHGAHPAVLWEVAGEPVELTAPALDPTWRATTPKGEALWRSPPEG